MANGTRQVTRILYKEIKQGDLLKILARSNKTKSGGGARDFRFGSYKRLLPVIQKMFPGTVKETRKRNGQSIQLDVHKGEFFWEDPQGTIFRKDSFFESPTDARGAEGRIVRVPEYACFDTKLIPKGGEGNRVLLLLIQLDDGSVWPHFAEEKTLRTPGLWDATVAKEIVSCLDARRHPKHAVIGFRDFTITASYCNGK